MPIDFTNMGEGICRDSLDQPYDHVWLNGQSSNIDDAVAWCRTAAAYTYGLVGVQIGHGIWHCHYDNGSIDSITTGAFNPTASDLSIGYSGTGQVKSEYVAGYYCYRNDVSMGEIAVTRIRFCISLTHSLLSFSPLPMQELSQAYI